MPCDGGVGTCRNEACGETACLNERGFCSDYCEESPEFVEEPAK